MSKLNPSLKYCMGTHPQKPNKDGHARGRCVHIVKEGKLTHCNILVTSIYKPHELFLVAGKKHCKVCFSKVNTTMIAIENKPVPVKNFKTITVRSERLPDDKGTQACIDHIERKRATIERVKGNNETVMMMRVLMDELRQYL